MLDRVNSKATHTAGEGRISLSRILKPEIVVGLAGPVGTDLRGLGTVIAEKLRSFGYRSERIRVSELIQSYCDDELREKISKAKHGERIRLLMAAGDCLRKQADSGDALIPLIITAIRRNRSKFNKNLEVPAAGKGDENNEAIFRSKTPAQNSCYIIDSLKHESEVSALRRIYGDNFILISGFSSIHERENQLCDAIAKSHTSTQNGTFKDEASELIKTDAKRPGEKLGQSLRDTFPLADFFIRVSGDYESELERFLKLYFGSPYITPRKDEFHMFEAKAKAYRSADLSRQVGAVIVDNDCNIVSSGCNEVPMANGGSYWPDQPQKFDNRDYAKGRDYNSVKKYEIIGEFIKFLSDNKIADFSGEGIEEIVNSLLFGNNKEHFKELRVSNLIEFGRVVHAEMNAITLAARRGLKIGGGSIYCTTFPCHMCARHIISAGLKRVVYIEPYPKSMTAELYPESVSIDGEASISKDGDAEIDSLKVQFEPFEGVAPTIYPKLYAAENRKDSRGYTLPWNKDAALPKLIRVSTGHPDLELPFTTKVANLSEVRLEHIEDS